MASPLEVVLLLDQVLLSSLLPSVEVIPPAGVMPPLEHRRVLPVLCYPRNMVIYHYPLIGVIFMVIYH